MKKIWLDTETTGLDSKVNRIVEIAMIYEDGKKIDEFHEFIKYDKYPDDYDRVVEITGLTPEILEAKGREEKIVYAEMIKFLDERIDRYDTEDKAMLCGYRIDFDDNFLRELFLRFNNNYYGSYFYKVKLDVSSIMAMAIQNGVMPILNNFKLEKLATFCNIPIKAHSAASDIKTTKEIYYQLEQKIIKGK